MHLAVMSDELTRKKLDENEASGDNDTVSGSPEPDSDLEFVSEEEAENPKALIAKLRKELAACKKERDEHLAGWQRTRADFVNARRQEEESRAELLKIAEARLVERLLPVLEAFDMARGNREAWEKVDSQWRVGVEYIHKELLAALGEHGLSEINPLGQAFNPNQETAVESRAVTDKTQDHTVVEVLQKGYALSGKVIRPARVVVGEYTTAS